MWMLPRQLRLMQMETGALSIEKINLLHSCNEDALVCGFSRDSDRCSGC